MFADDIDMSIRLVKDGETKEHFHMISHYFPWSNGWCKQLRSELNNRFYAFGGEMKIKEVLILLKCDIIFVSFEYHNCVYTAERYFD